MGLRERPCNRRCPTVAAGETLRHQQGYAKIQDVCMLRCRVSDCWRGDRGWGMPRRRAPRRLSASWQDASLGRAVAKTTLRGTSLPSRRQREHSHRYASHVHVTSYMQASRDTSLGDTGQGRFGWNVIQERLTETSTEDAPSRDTSRHAPRSRVRDASRGGGSGVQ